MKKTYLRNFWLLALLFFTIDWQKAHASSDYTHVWVSYTEGQSYFGHIAFEIKKPDELTGEYYSYPSGNNKIGDLQQFGPKKQTVILPLNEKQYNRFKDWYENSFFSKFENNDYFTYAGHYHMIKLNCAHFVSYALRAMGYDTYRFFSIGPKTPHKLFGRVKKISQQIKTNRFVLDLERVKISYIQKKQLTEKEFKSHVSSLGMFSQLFGLLYPNFEERAFIH